MQDSPSQNFATLNPVAPETQLASANLESVALPVGGTMNYQTIDINSHNNCYWEWTTNTAAFGIYTYLGIGGGQPAGGLSWPDNYLYYSNSVAGGFNFNNPGSLRGTYSSVTITGDQPIEPGQTYGFTYNDGTLQVLNGGVVTCTLSNIPTDIGLYFGSSMDAGPTQTINFGQQPFLYTPPDGFSALQTQNLPEATITDGRDHFQAIVAPGAVVAQLYQSPIQDSGQNNFDTYVIVDGNDFGSSSVEQYAFDMFVEGTNNSITFTNKGSSGWWNVWYSTDGINWTQDGGDIPRTSPQTITVAPSARFLKLTTALSSTDSFMQLTAANGGGILQIAQQTTFPNGLWWVKSRVSDGNTNQHQLVDSVRGGNLALQCPAAGPETAYIAPAGNSVAWCWNAPTEFTNAAGTNGASIESSGRVDIDAGFSIVEYRK